MTAAWRPAADRLVAALRGVFRDRLRSVLAYGSHMDGSAESRLSCLALVSSLTVGDLEACAQLAGTWQHDGVGTPLLLPEDEFRRSLDAFPLEYGEMLRAHELLYGPNPFDGLTIEPSDLRRACETQIKSHLVHLREGFIETGGVPGGVSRLVAASAPAFASLLRNIARLSGSVERDRASATLEGARLAQLPDRVVAGILALEHQAAMQTTDAARLFPEYFATVEQLARFIDGWNA